MDVKKFVHATRVCFFALLLALGEVSLATAGEAIASDTEASSTIFVTDEGAVAPPSLPQSVEGELVFIEDTPQSAVVTPRAVARPSALIQQPTHVARGDLKVVPSRQTRPKLNTLRPLVRPATKPRATLQTVEVIQPSAEPALVANRTQPLSNKNTLPQKKISPAAQQLITAHQLSLRAESIDQYTQIIDGCATAIEQRKLARDQRGFARQLSSWALNRRGQLRTDAGQQDLARADFQAALELNARNWRALHNRGVTNAQSGQFAEAFDDFNAVIEINPHYAKAYANRATLYVQAKDLQAATKDYEQAIDRDAEFATAYVGLGRVCHMLGRWDDAIQYFTSAVELEPSSADIVCSRGDLHADMGNYGEALTDYARTIELDPEFAHAYRNGAWLLATCPDERFLDPENAVLGAQQALEYSYGEQHVALDTLAAALASNDQFDEAITTLTKAVDLAPEHVKENYLTRLELYQQNLPFRTEPISDVSQVNFEE